MINSVRCWTGHQEKTTMVDVSPTSGMAAYGVDPSRDPHQMFLDACRANGVSADTVRGPGRDRWIVAIRRKIAEMLFEVAKQSYSDIGRMLGGRHHTTIMSLLNPEMNARKKARPCRKARSNGDP